MRVYLDNSAIQRPLDDQRQIRVRSETEAVLGLLALCEQGALELVISGVHLIENGRCPYPDRREHVQDVLGLAGSYALLDEASVRRARRYEAVGIGRFDALHLAVAVEARVEYFCSTDDRLLRKGKAADTNGTSVVSPLELVILLQ